MDCSNMIIDKKMLNVLSAKAKASERLRANLDLRNSKEDASQRMLNALEAGTKVPIHRHVKTSETAICIEGCIDWIFYEELPNLDAGGPVHDGEKVIDESQFVEIARFRICPREGKYGIQIPQMTWHSIDVYEPTTIFEAKDGAYIAK